jgi:uncharacterized UPF0160 family protein
LYFPPSVAHYLTLQYCYFDSHYSGHPVSDDCLSHNQEHLFGLEEELGKSGKAIYVLYPDESGKWRIQAVPTNPDSFESRKSLPEAWRGVRDDALSQLTGVGGCIFIHASGFIGGESTKFYVSDISALSPPPFSAADYGLWIMPRC